MTIKNYWFLAKTALPLGYVPFEQSLLSEPLELMRRLKPPDGVILGNWNESELLGNVFALGVCLDRSASGAKIDWREVDICLRPNSSGKTHWRTKSFFGFANTVIERYCLADIFAENFPDLDTLTFTSRTVIQGSARRPPTIATPGYVYLIRSPHGFKIGKTINIKERTRLFTVKLPFPIKLEHYSWFDNYSEAERMLHDTFHAKRLEGEWFDLSPTDIEHIKTLGKPATAEELRGL